MPTDPFAYSRYLAKIARQMRQDDSDEAADEAYWAREQEDRTARQRVGLPPRQRDHEGGE